MGRLRSRIMARYQTHRTRGRWRNVGSPVDSYATRIECAMIASLALALMVVHLPFGTDALQIGWHVVRPAEKVSIDLIDVRPLPPETGQAPITSFQAEDKNNEGGDTADGDEVSAEGALSGQSYDLSRLQRMKGMKVLDTAEMLPEIVGGMGAYYIHIIYPEAAIEEGIEGRLVLSFVVETDGSTDEIHVLQSLHPACDSAAVRALRRTRFVPGRQNGEAVSVRMKLPVVFKLIEPPGSEETTSEL